MGTDFIYRREVEDVPISPFERQLMTDIFGSGHEKKLSKLKNHFYKDIPGIKSAMYDDLVARGYYRTNPEAVRTKFGCIGGAAMIVAGLLAVLLIFLFIDLSFAAICPGIGLFGIAVSMLVAARYMPRKTDAGAEAAARWKAFKEYLRNIDKYADVEAQKEIWDRWLPYAIAFGIDKDYIRKFEGVNAPAPGWYIPSPTMYGPYRRWYYGPSSGQPMTLPGSDEGGSSGGGSFGGSLSDASRGMGASLATMSAGLGAMLSSTSNTFTSRPSSSSSGGGWSGGGGFSGGGSFGGGGGGGGGGGFG
jgi:hypothetical protein